jgi:outer membrane protein OmpA-like peptidoglycan-associated protein
MISKHVLTGALFLALFCSGCEQAPQLGAREKGALGGAALGAGLGAIVGNQVGSTGAGIAIGSAFGALSGGLIGNEIDSSDQALAEREDRLNAGQREIEENRRLIDELKGKGFEASSTSRGVLVNLPDVLFEFDRSELTGDARGRVGEIYNALRDMRDRHVSVEGHTDSVGTVSYNQRLSESRARSVADALASEGLPRRQLSTRGFGESQPVSSNESTYGRQKNRRVEVIVENR